MRALTKQLSALAVFALLLVAQPAFAQPWLAPGGVNPVEAELISEQSSIQAGQPFWLGIKLDVEHEWHIYWKNPGDAGVPPAVSWNLPDGFTAGPLLWPSPERFVSNDFTGYGYHDQVMLLVQVTPPEDLQAGQEIKLSGEVEWVACSDMCVPGFKTVDITLISANEAVPSAQKSLLALEKAKQRLPRSIWAVRACQQGDLIELEISSAPNRQLLTASFIPNDHGVINDGAEQKLEFNEKEPGRYVLRLQRSEDPVGEASALQGLLVLTEPLMHDESHQVLSLNLPLSDQCFSGFAASASISQAKPPAEEVPAAAATAKSAPTAAAPAGNGEAPLSFAWALVLAVAGGLFLNLMPCVLPVISLKLFHFMNMAKENRAEIFKHGLAFCSGVLISFWVLVGILLTLKHYGAGVGWGFQLQDPRFVAFMIVLLFVFTLSLWGVFEFGMSIASKAGNLEGKTKGKMGTFMSGVLATVVATPCTGPFMGPVLGLAMTVPPAQSMVIFSAMGIGMSLPYLLCSAFPQLIRFLPKPGAWMETFKQFMGFLMLGSVIWLTWVFGSQTGNNALVQLFVGLLCFALACWVYGQWGHTLRRGFAKVAMWAVVVTLTGAGIVSAHLAANSPFVGLGEDGKVVESGPVWESYSEEKLNEYLSEGRPVFIDFTAKWCITCQANKKTTLSADAVNDAFDDKNVVLMRADWTRRDPEISRKLEELGRAGVPVYALYDAENEQPQVMSSVPLSESEVLRALDKIETTD